MDLNCHYFPYLVSFQLLIPLLALLFGLGNAQVATTVVQEPYEENPGYTYAFEVNDDEEQVYQAHAQTMEDKVRTN